MASSPAIATTGRSTAIRTGTGRSLSTTSPATGGSANTTRNPGTSRSRVPAGSGYRQEPGYDQEPGYYREPEYQREPGYRHEPGYDQEPEYQREPGYGQEPGYDQEPGYYQEPEYQPAPAYSREPGYRTGNGPASGYRREPGYRPPGGRGSGPGGGYRPGPPRKPGIPRNVLIGGVAVLLVAAAAIGGWVYSSHRSAPHPHPSAGAQPSFDSRSAPPSPAPPQTAANPAQHHCVAAPHTCGYPDETNTGVPAGLKLLSVPGQVRKGKGWAWHDGGVYVYGKNAVFAGYRVQGQVSVSGSGAVIRDNSISDFGNDPDTNDGVNLFGNPSNVTIENNTIFSPYGTKGDKGLAMGIKDVTGTARGTRVIANNIADASTGIQLYIGLIEGNYIHDITYADPTNHLNGTTTNGSTIPLTIEHNTILNSASQTDAVSLFEDFGPEANVLITNNLLAGGGYTIYGGQNPGGPLSYNVQITDNRISTVYFPQGGFFGPVTAFVPTSRGNVWSGNFWDNTGAEISP